jgi:hypothetical protein
VLAALALFASLAAQAFAAPVAQAARVNLGPDAVVVGQKLGAAASRLDCKASKVQHTVRKCELKAAELTTAGSLGNNIAKLTLNAHFQDDVVNMAVVYAPGLPFNFVLGLYKTAIGQEPKTEYWADDDHLYASYIWVDGDAEVELTDTIKGDKLPGGVTAYVSSLTRNRALSPDDAH